MKTLDQIFGWLLIALGVAHCVTSFRIQPLSHMTVWLSGTAVAIIVCGFLNVSRARGSDMLAQVFSFVANLFVLSIAVALAWPARYHLLHDWQSSGTLAVTLVELLFSFRR